MPIPDTLARPRSHVFRAGRRRGEDRAERAQVGAIRFILFRKGTQTGMGMSFADPPFNTLFGFGI